VLVAFVVGLTSTHAPEQAGAAAHEAGEPALATAGL
jgi:hypothetical protein